MVSGAKRIIVTMEHSTKNNGHKILKECSLPLTGKHVVDTLITERAMFKFDKESREMTLHEIAPEYSVDDIKASTGCEFKVSPNLTTF